MTLKGVKESKKERTDHTSQPPAILALGAPLDTYYGIEFWRGLHQEALRTGVRLVYVCGGIQQNYLAGIPTHGAPNENRSTLLYQLFDPGLFDGVVFWGAQFLHDGPSETLENLAENFQPLPIISIGWQGRMVEGLSADNLSPMYHLVNHLIQHHGHTKIAYLSGDSLEPSWEETQRQLGYEGALKAAGLTLDPQLIVTGLDIQDDYLRLRRNLEDSENWAESAMGVLVEKRGLIPGVDFDALAARDDASALRAMAYLTGIGYQIPSDVAVVGFDDIEQSRCSIPALTTGTQSFYRFGIQAMRGILDRVLGRPSEGAEASHSIQASPEPGDHQPSIQNLQTILPLQNLESQIIIRESCGCVNRRMQILSGEPISRQDIVSSWPPKAVQLLDSILNRGDGYPDAESWVALGRMIRSLADELARDGIDPTSIPEALLGAATTAYSQGDVPILPTPPNTQLFSFANDILQRRLLSMALDRDTRQVRIDTAGRVLFSQYDLDYILRGLQAQLPLLGGIGAALVLFDSSLRPADGARLIFWLWNGRRLDINPGEGIPFPTTSLLPQGYWPHEIMSDPGSGNAGMRTPGIGGTSLHVELVQFAGRRIGYLVLESGNDLTAVTAGLARHLSTGLQGAMLVNALQQANREIQALSRTDSLTGLLNRRSFEEHIKEECIRADRYKEEHFQPCLLFLDLDNFKYCNDRYGHKAGDLVLQHFAGILTSQCRSSDKIARFGGDEFVILLIEITLDNAIQTAKRIIEAFAQQESLMEVIILNSQADGQSPQSTTLEQGLSCSIGIAQYRPGTPWDILINQGDQALYAAKAKGKNRYMVYSPDPNR